MAIRPLDMQVMIPKLQDVTRMTHLDQQKGQVMQENIANTMQKETDMQGHTVVQSNEEEKTRNEQDAKEQGKNAYYRDPRERKKEQNDQDKDEVPASYHKIDIKI